MAAIVVVNNNTFHLQGRESSYIMALNGSGDLLHVCFGKKLKDRDYSKMRTSWHAWTAFDLDGCTLENAPQEYPSYGYTDLRPPAYIVKNGQGNCVSQLKYSGYEIYEGETPKIQGLPCVTEGNKSVSTLAIKLSDGLAGICVTLYYTVFDEYDVIVRSAVITNISNDNVEIKSAYSANIDMARPEKDIIYFSGGWAREREYVRRRLCQGEICDIANARGGSGHCINPFIMIADKAADENSGEVHGFSLIYSGNHSSRVSCDQLGNIRVQQGINPFGFSWKIGSGESFYTPQSVIVYSDNGIGGISRELHDLYRYNLCRSKWSDKPRPVLINNWEATYFDFDEEKLISIAQKAKETGIELFVLDDGWFGNRNDDRRGLGDWYVNRSKLPSGIDGLAERINDIGLKFGLWIEPEMVNPDSDLYRTHPDWAIHVPGREPAQSRSQLILDLSRKEVCDYIIKAISDLLSSANIEYIKWDMNRPMTDMPCEGYNHKYTLGFYRIMEAITGAFPNVLFEGCSGGGGRFDAGVLAYMPQIWTSDNSDAVARYKIQYSTSMGYPVSSMGAHVTASPNHQNGRQTSLETRANTAYAGIFGYELDITKMSSDEIDEVKKQVAFYKDIRQLIVSGDFYRLISPYETNYCSWCVVSKDKSEAFVFIGRVLSIADYEDQLIKLNGLSEDFDYKDIISDKIYGGDELMYMGIRPSFKMQDFASVIMHLKRI